MGPRRRALAELVPAPVPARRARVTVRNDDAHRYVRETNAGMPQATTVSVLTSLLSDDLRAEPRYRLPVPTLAHGDADRAGDIAGS